jgi:hypothetical protein
MFLHEPRSFCNACARPFVKITVHSGQNLICGQHARVSSRPCEYSEARPGTHAPCYYYIHKPLTSARLAPQSLTLWFPAFTLPWFAFEACVFYDVWGFGFFETAQAAFAWESCQIWERVYALRLE